MEDFVVSARKYRPQTFDTVVGQANITQTLVKAIENNHLAQSFLFCGPRGVGKTTCARIMARTVNELSQENKGEVLDYSFNIFELDAASNNSVDDIRSLVDQVRVPPQVGKYKVYIIDEVHMLSTGAFNAFLKTLEEPPPYAIFILATTEKHKVLPTILSRCQIFNFSRIEVGDIAKHLAEIAVKEGITISDDALHIIAEKADGALRDALSIFDQMVSFAGTTVTYEDVIANLNVLDYDYYFKLTDAFIAGDRTLSLLTFNSILQKGFDGHNFLNGLANHMRNLLFSATPATAALLETGQQIREKYMAQAKACDTRFILNALNILSEADVNYKQSKNNRLLVELALLKLCGITEKLGEKKNSDDAIRLVGSSVVAPASLKSATTSPPQAAPAEKLAAQPMPVAAPDAVKVVVVAEKYTDEPALTTNTTHVEEPGPSTDDLLPHVPAVPENAANNAQVASSEDGPKKFSSRLSTLKLRDITSIKGSNPVQNTTREQSSTGQNEESFAGKPATDFTLAQLWDVWNEYTARIKEQNRQSYYATLTNNKPVMREKYKVELVIVNNIQKKDIDDDKSNLLDFLRLKLNNWQIQFDAVVEENEDNPSLIYSPEAKFKAMANRNPALVKMKQLFDLDIDYDS